MSEEKKREAENDSGVIIKELGDLLDSITQNRQKMMDLRADYKAKLQPYSWLNGEPVEVPASYETRPPGGKQ